MITFTLQGDAVEVHRDGHLVATISAVPFSNDAIQLQRHIPCSVFNTKSHTFPLLIQFSESNEVKRREAVWTS